MGHIPFCFYPSLLEQWLNCFNNLYMGKTFKRQIKCSLESVQIELSRGQWILNTTHINLNIQSYPHSQHTPVHTHTHNPHILNTAYINPYIHNHPHSQHSTCTRAHAHTHTITHTHSFFFTWWLNYVKGNIMCLLLEILPGLV